MKSLLLLSLIFIQVSLFAQNREFIPIVPRADIQAEVTSKEQIIDGEWVAVGIKNNYSIQWDYTKMFNGKPSFRFELQQEDNTLEGYSKGETKGRAELSYCYATRDDVKNLSPREIELSEITKTVYFHGKGISPQGGNSSYTFSIFVPAALNKDVYTIFAQWHGMPDRTVLQTPSGEIKQVSREEFARISETTIFNKETGHEKIKFTDKTGKVKFKAGKPNGWLIEQGGFPPLAFGFAQGYFYIKTNSDRKWLSDKTDRCNATPEKNEIMQPIKSEYKVSTIAYKTAFENFPKDQWVTFHVNVNWTVYGGKSEAILKPGKLYVDMCYEKNGNAVVNQIVNADDILVGRNDDEGYYFKFGIYRVASSTEPVCYNLAGYEEKHH